MTNHLMAKEKKQKEVLERIYAQESVEKVGQRVKLAGWVASRRDHGQIIFIDLRDRSGLIQLVFLPESPELYQLADSLRNEWVIGVIGRINKRPSGMENKNLPTGQVEMTVEELEVFSQAKSPPFEIVDQQKVREERRLEYRYLDLRRPMMQKNLIFRYRLIKLIRDFLDQQGFIELETPILAKSTPEGARDFLVPSRLHPGQFYALPQAPQQFKQLLMIAGFDKYFQIARCFRDEDLRGDRQPEFTQLDLEMSFVEQEEILSQVEELCLEIVKEMVEFDSQLSSSLTFRPFLRLSYQEALEKYGTDKPDLRKDKKNPRELAFVWIVDWPLFEYNQEERRYDPCHHIFTAPRSEDIPLLDKDPLAVRSWQHDLVLNGHEIGGGSIRIHQPAVQQKIFKLVGLTDEEIKNKFGHLLRAFEYGTPPHGGIAIGLDRLLMILLNQKSIRQVIAFPKTGDGRDLAMEAPSPASLEQLKDLNIKVVK